MNEQQVDRLVNAADRLTSAVLAVRSELGWICWAVLFVAIGTCFK